MAPDAERVADTRARLVKAQHDLRAVDALLEPSVEEIAEAAKRAAALHGAILERLPAQARPS